MCLNSVGMTNIISKNGKLRKKHFEFDLSLTEVNWSEHC